MKPRAGRALHLAACLCGLFAAAVLSSPLGAQPQEVTPADATPVYQDRLIGGGKLTPDVSTGDNTTSDTSGLARSIRVDAVGSVLHQDGPSSAPDLHEYGLVTDAQWDTVSYGAWSANLAARIGGSNERISANGSQSDSNFAFAVHERAMPFDDGWQADNALGDLNAPLINLAHVQPRFLLAQGPMQGLETEWRGPSGIQIVAGGGTPGVYEGIKVPTFQTLGGTTATLGAEWSPAPAWSIGGEFAAAHDVSLYYQPLDPNLFPLTPAGSPRISTDTTFLTAAWQGTGLRVQGNLIDGTVDGNNNAFGAWVDAALTRGAATQTFGLFRIDPNLTWGNQLITNDVQGGYYRADYQSRRWNADFGVDEVKSVSGNGADITFVNTAARYQLSRDTGIGGVANVRHGGGDTAWSLEGYLDRVNSLGTGRVQMDYATDAQTRDASLTLQQSWNTRAGRRLSTTAAVDHIENNSIPGTSQDATVARLAVYGGGDLTARLSLDGSVQWAQAVQGRAAPSTSADVTLSWQVNRAWSLLVSYYENRVGSWEPLVITSPLNPPTPVPVASMGESGIFLTVRYQDSRGAHFIPLGGNLGSGSGRLSGIIYLDANENGRLDAGETVVANVTVILDGRFSVRTDSNGRYDFPAVASGHHVVTVQSDNLPLPWTMTSSGRTEVEVSTRNRTEIDVGALRIK
ncbi:MAG TPA: carboxypeptidase-like regulatory domain-containing protein [Steroidobacteraceae bacterium]|jgi:hypothetical protein